MSSVEELRARASAIAAAQDAPDGVVPTAIDGLLVIRHREPTSFTPTVYSPVLCTILQGAKETRTSERRLKLGAGDTLVVSHQLPVTARVTGATAREPYLAVVCSIDLAVIRSLYSEIGGAEVYDEQEEALRAGANNDSVSSALLRLIELNDRLVERTVMAPLISREFHFRLLMSEHGGMLRSLLDVNSGASRIAKAIDLIRADYASPLTVQAMAKAASMSESTFFEHFKRITGTTPLRYQKECRLLEAQRLIQYGDISIADAALRVGYESASQFSREYSRKFGHPPRDDAGPVP